MENYKKGRKLGEGTFGAVFEAFDKVTNERVAIKRIKQLYSEKHVGAPLTVIREIKTLQELKHKNIIELKEVFVYKNDYHLVYPFYDYTLTKIITDSPANDLAEVKSYMKMLLEGIEYLHSNWIIHRDLKPDNLLIGSDGVLRIADFGAAKFYGTQRELTPTVVTLCYRAPELLFGSRYYGPPVDIWAAACIFAELLLRKIFLPGTSEIEQLKYINAALGNITREKMAGLDGYPNAATFKDAVAESCIRTAFQPVGPQGVDLLEKMFVFDPNERITARAALDHPYFKTGVAPKPCDQLVLPRIETVPEKKTSSALRSSGSFKILDFNE